MKHVLFAAALVMAAPLAAAPALAQDSGRALQRLSAADADNDGQITRAEARASRAAQFDRADRNGDGAISNDDIPQFAGGRGQTMFEQLMTSADANGDGRITRSEWEAAPQPAFERADVNGDGVVTQAELQALQGQRAR
jgi:hypothetical protein